MGTVTKLPPPRRAGILQQVRDEGYRAGWGQAAMANEDDAYLRGMADGEGRFRWKRWFAVGFVIGFLAGYVL